MNVKLGIVDILQIISSNNIGTFLVCKNIDRKRTRANFVHIKEKISNKLAGRKARLLFHAGRIVFIKSNLTRIPICYARC